MLESVHVYLRTCCPMFLFMLASSVDNLGHLVSRQIGHCEKPIKAVVRNDQRHILLSYRRCFSFFISNNHHLDKPHWL